MNIGVLGFQGDFQLHQKILDKINVSNILIKDKKQLKNIEALIIPGGESTVIFKLIIKYGFFKELIEFAKNKSIFGTCAGAILMSSKINDRKVRPLGLIDVTSIRNAWGKQIDSFTTNVNLTFEPKNSFKATFIRAPKFICNNKKAQILSKFKNDIVLLRNKRHLISSFHPEISGDTRIHEYFIKMINGR